MHDLEIRGAGEVLGESQSGEMQEVGFQLYADMLKAAVSALKAGREPDLAAPLGVTTEINLHAPALLPENYCSDVHERLVLYKRLANCETTDELDAMQEELVDRFGALPEPAQALLACHRLRARGEAAAAWSRSTPGPSAASIQFAPNPPFDAGNADPAGAEGRPHPLRRPRPRAHRARRADARRARRAAARVPVAARAERCSPTCCRRRSTCSSATGCRRTTCC